MPNSLFAILDEHVEGEEYGFSFKFELIRVCRQSVRITFKANGAGAIIDERTCGMLRLRFTV
ncbi:hypothetical protein OAG68_02480, partial [bacterium]|nr:hypothetical protein [bacterium]